MAKRNAQAKFLFRVARLLDTVRRRGGADTSPTQSGPAQNRLTDRSEWVCPTARRGWPIEVRDWPMEERNWLVEVRGLPRPNEVNLRMDMVNRSEGFGPAWGRSDAGC